MHEGDAGGKAEGVGVAAGDSEGGLGNIGGEDFRLWQLARQRQRDAASAGADIHDAGVGFHQALADDGERGFDHVLGFRARDEDARLNLKRHAPELLPTGEVLRGRAGRAALKQMAVGALLLEREFGFGMGIKKSAVAVQDVHEQHLSGDRS